MNLNDLYEMRDSRDAYERDVDNSQAGMGKQSRSDVTGEEEPSGVFTVVINGKPWKTGSSNEMFALASRVADKHSDKKVAVKWPTGELNTVKSRDVTEGYHNSKTIITEALITQKLWENAGRKLMEAQLTADQINQIFQQVEQGATAAGGNRTLIGKGKDAAEAVNKAWEDLKTKVQNSGPIKGVDAMYDQAAEKLKQATGGDQGVMKYVQKYRDFAKAHPVAQSLIYAALIAAAGITGVAPGGAAVLGLFKLVDKLLQGEKFSSAAYSGAKTGAMAYGAAKVGDYIKGQMAAKADPGMAYKPDVRTPTAGQGAGQSYDAGGTFASTAENPGVRRLANWAVKNFDQNTYDYVPKGMDVFVYDKAGNLVQSITSDGSMRRAGIYTGKQMLDVMKKSAGVYESINLSESQIFLLIGKIVERQHKIDEGIMDTIKGAAGKAVDWAKTKGTNLTTKVTADKLLQAWKKAGSPTDSEAVAKIIQSAGIPSDSIKQVYGTMKIPFAGEPGAAAAPAPAANQAAGGIPAVPAKPAATAQTPAAAPAPAAKPATPQATSTTAGAPSKVTYGGLLAPKKSAAPVADFSKTGFSGYQTATAKQPAKQPSMAEGHTEVKDKEGKVVSWKDDSEWHPAEKNKQGQPKDPRGVVTHLSDVARRKTAAQQDMAEAEVDSDGYSVDHADSGEYDYEGDQARDQMNTIVRAARRLDGLLDDNENMPEWVQMKVTLAADYLDTAADYIESNQEPELEEGWKEKLGGAALAGALALGAGGAQARVMPGDDPGVNRLTGKPIATQQAADTAPTQSTSSISVAKSQAQYDVDTQTLTYKGKQYKWNSDAQATGQGEVVTAPSMAVGSRSMGSTKVELNPNGTYTKVPANESQEKVGNMDADKFDSAMARLKQLAGAGPLKTVYDPTKRVYRNIPVAVQPQK